MELLYIVTDNVHSSDFLKKLFLNTVTLGIFCYRNLFAAINWTLDGQN